MKTILVPTDFSATAAGALDFASILARKLKDIQIIVLHAWQLPPPIAEVPFDLIKVQKEELEKSAALELNEMGQRLSKEGLNVKVVLKEGLAETVLLEAIEDLKVSLVVMGTLGNTGLGTEIFGSTASHILENASCPVLAIPPVSAGMKEVHKITYATDFKTADISAIQQLCVIAEPFHAQLNILHIAGQAIPPEEERALMKRFMEKVNAAITYNNLSFQIICGNDTKEELERFLASDATDIVVLSTHKRSLFEKIFGVGITRDIALNSNVPVMAFHSVTEKPMIF